jgi:hypothetical protein
LQEDLQNKSVVLTAKTAKLTGRGLAKLMRAALRKINQARSTPKQGKQTVKQLAKGGSPQHIEISDDNIKAFEPFARKFRVSYALQRDNSESPPKWLVYFRAKDADALTGAFKAFSAKLMKRETEKPSTREAMRKFRAVIKNAVRDRTKHKHREGPEL